MSLYLNCTSEHFESKERRSYRKMPGQLRILHRHLEQCDLRSRRSSVFRVSLLLWFRYCFCSPDADVLVQILTGKPAWKTKYIYFFYFWASSTEDWTLTNRLHAEIIMFVTEEFGSIDRELKNSKQALLSVLILTAKI